MGRPPICQYGNIIAGAGRKVYGFFKELEERKKGERAAAV
jgi:hypothetical protein